MSKKAVVVLSFVAILCVAAGLVFRIVFQRPEASPQTDGSTTGITIPGIDSKGVSLHFRAVDKYFYLSDGDSWNGICLKGVNIGLTEATTDLADPDVSYETYREWLVSIAQMHANTVRVFTVMPPQFYAALYDHNASAQSPLYLIQGIWFNENYMYEGDHAFEDDEKIITSFQRAARETVDIIHGNSDYTSYGKIEKAVYPHDLSPYLAGYILGLEWEPGFVQRTNEQVSQAGYTGTYLQTTDQATAFESFLCRVGDALAAYETETYSAQAPVAFLNWATTDTLSHSNEPFEEEDMVSVNTETIVPTDNYYCGLFAAIDVYPYYPEFMNYQPEYLETDENGDIDPYRAYLADLRTQYSVPVLIAEFGVPASRGTAHKSAVGMHQGGITEEQQGEAIVSMMRSIAAEEYAGFLIFSWQDEWFKQTWNTFRYAPEDAAVRTPNVQSAEQGYGLLAMEPGERSVCLIDGLTDDWENTVPILQSGGDTVSAMWDEGYLYLKIETAEADFYRDTLLVPIQITGRGSAFSEAYSASFSEAADFLLVINGEKETRLLVDGYQDLFYYMYAYQKGVFDTDGRFEQSGTGFYTPVRQFISNEIVLPLTGEVIAPQYIESGLLTYGITDPDSPQYHSLADFYCRGQVIEVRIPWYLLNVMNSTAGVCLKDFYRTGEVDTEDMPGVRIGIGAPDQEEIPMGDLGYSTKAHSSFHTRLKKSYDIVRDAMKDINLFQAE